MLGLQSPEDTLPDLKLGVTMPGTITLTRTRYQLDLGFTVCLAMDIMAHPNDCRAGRGWMVSRYPKYFDHPNPAADTIAGCGAYSGNEEHFDVEKLRKKPVPLTSQFKNGSLEPIVPPVHGCGMVRFRK